MPPQLEQMMLWCASRCKDEYGGGAISPEEMYCKENMKEKL
jgi:hypothetical protein